MNAVRVRAPLVAEHAAAGTLHRGDGPYVPPPAPQTALRFPGKVLALPSGTFLVSDTAHHQLVELATDLVTERRRLGTGERGLVDGSRPRFSEPQGLVALPAPVAARVGYPLGVALLPDGSVAVADTYNGAVRRYDPGTRTVGTLARDLREPSDLLVDGDSLVVVESAAHRLVRVPIPASTRVHGAAHRVRRARTDLAPGPLALRIAFTPPTGQHLDTRFGDPTSLTVAASPPELLVAGAGTAPGLARELRFADTGPVEGVLQVSVAPAACDTGDGVFAACHRYQQDWGIPVRLVDGAPTDLVLDLRAL
jgi:hypothetical protein